ncbi:MAG: hypothetical protein PVSMB9_06980 [Candidatus Dormibacteria bacterium]
MPLRLLGLVADLDSLEGLGGGAFIRYAQVGVSVTVACAGGGEKEALTSRARQLGIEALFLLDYRPAERGSTSLTDLLTDIIRAVQPHVVVLGADEAAVLEAGTRAFARARQEARGTAALPAKLYYRVRPGADRTSISTAVPVGSGGRASLEPFQRVYPSPWVTGVLEQDLFAGLRAGAEAAGRPIDELLAS